MALEPIIWAIKHAPVADLGERMILIVLAEHGHADGTDCYPSVATIMEDALMDDSTVRRKLKIMQARGLIAPGDPKSVRHIPAYKRPKNWDLMIPLRFFPDLDKINRKRSEKDRPPLTAAMRPELGPAPERKRRADAKKPTAKERRALLEAENAALDAAEAEAKQKEGSGEGAGYKPGGGYKPGPGLKPAGGLKPGDPLASSPTPPGSKPANPPLDPPPVPTPEVRKIAPLTSEPENAGDGEQLTIAGTPSPPVKKQTNHQLAYQLARAYIEAFEEVAPIVAKKGVDPLKVVADLLVPFFEAGCEFVELGEALKLSNDPIPTTARLNKCLKSVRERAQIPSQPRQARTQGQRPRPKGMDVNASWGRSEEAVGDWDSLLTDRPPVGAS